MSTSAPPLGGLRASRPFPERTGSQGYPDLQADHHDRSQSDRDHVCRRVLHVLFRRRAHGAADPRRAGRTRATVSIQRAIQPIVHHARHGHAAVLRNSDRVRVRQPGAAPADRRPRCRVSATQRIVVLALCVRRDRSRSAASSPRVGRRTSGGPLTPRFPTRSIPRDLAATLWILGLIVGGLGTILGAVNMITTVVCLRAPGHDDVPDADLHLEHPGDQHHGAGGLSAVDRPRCSGWPPTATSARTSLTRPTAESCCGSTCSGSSATPRCTSSRCRSSASSPKSSRCSPANRCLATPPWSTPPSASGRCRSRCGPIISMPPARCCCRFFPSPPSSSRSPLESNSSTGSARCGRAS